MEGRTVSRATSTGPLLTVRHYRHGTAVCHPAAVHAYVVGLCSPQLLRVMSP